jgi:hypothetical protein
VITVFSLYFLFFRRDDIKQFTSKCSTLSPSVVVPLLCQRLTSPQWQTRLKALVLLEGLLSTEQANDVVCQAAKFAPSISENCSSVQAQVKEVALRLLPVVQGGGNVSAGQTAAAAHSQVGDMLGDLSLSSAPAPASSSQQSAFGFLDADQPVPVIRQAAAPAPAMQSSFDFLSDSAPTPQAAQSASAFNFLDAPAPSAAPMTSAFNFLDATAPAPAPAASSSAFSFLSDAPAAPASAPAPLGAATGMMNKSSSFKAAPAGQTELEKMLANSSGYLPSMTARPASNAFEMEFGYGQAQQQPMQNAYMPNMQYQQQFSAAVSLDLLSFYGVC